MLDRFETPLHNGGSTEDSSLYFLVDILMAKNLRLGWLPAQQIGVNLNQGRPDACAQMFLLTWP